MILVSSMWAIRRTGGRRSGINPKRRCIADYLSRHLGDSDNFDVAGIKGCGNDSIEDEGEAQNSAAGNLHNGCCYCCICKFAVWRLSIAKVNLIHEKSWKDRVVGTNRLAIRVFGGKDRGRQVSQEGKKKGAMKTPRRTNRAERVATLNGRGW